MNFRIIFHLIHNDWQKLKWPLVALWCIITITALRWLLHDPASFEFPYWTYVSQQASFFVHNKNGGSPPGFALWGSLLGVGLAAALGLQERGRALVSPVRTRERTTAKVIALLIFLVLPQALCVGLNLVRQGFSLEVAVPATLGYGVTVLMVLGVVALFGAWCASWKHLMAGITGVVGTYAIYAMMPGATPLPSLKLFDSHLWAAIADFRSLLALGLAAILLGGFRFIQRGRLSAAQQVATAVTLLIGSLAISVMPRFWSTPQPVIAQSKTTTSDVAAIRPVIRPQSVWMHSSSDTFAGALSSKTKNLNQKTFYATAGSTVTGIIDTVGAQPGEFVIWQVAPSGTLLRDGRTIATRVQDLADYQGSSRVTSGYPLLQVEPAELAAMVDALPNKTAPMPEPQWSRQGEEPQRNYLGCFSPVEPMASWDEGPLTLESSFTGTVYRYEQVADVILSDHPVRIRIGDAIYQIKRRVSELDATCAELTITRPTPGFTGKPGTSEPADVPWRYYLHVPGENLNLALESLGERGGPVLSGAIWQQQIIGSKWLATQNRILRNKPEVPWFTPDKIQDTKRFNALFAAADAHLILLKPTVVAHLPTTTITIPVQQSRDSERVSDYSLYKRDERNEWIFIRDHLPVRPDPRTCTRAEFGRWLRCVPSSQAYALTAYARRFTDVLARTQSHSEDTIKAIELATPDGSRRVVLDQLVTLDSPASMIGMISRRGWADECADLIRWCYLHRSYYSDYGLEHVLRLEDPATYPKLLGDLVKNPYLATYEQIRLLPGIEPELDRAITEALKWADLQPATTTYASSYESRAIHAIYQISAARGNAKSLDLLIAIQNELYRKDGNQVSLSNSLLDRLLATRIHHWRVEDEWTKHLKNKSSKNLRYDPLTRRWDTLSPQ